MTSRPIRVAVYSRQDIVREGIASLLSRHTDKVDVVPTPCGSGEPDPHVVLYDVMGLLEGDTRFLSHLVETTSAKVLAVGHRLRPDLVGRALGTGVDGFFAVEVDEAALLAAVESAATGWAVGDPGEDPTVGSSASEARRHRLGADAGLTERETQVLSLIARGHSNRAIAAELFLSVNSVKTYTQAVYRKIGAASRAHAVGWAIRHGFAAEPREPGPTG